MRLVYLGTPQIAVPPLEALLAADHDIALVVSGPDRRRGRGSQVSPSPVKQAALERGIAVTESVDDVLAVDADLGVVVAFGQLIRPHVLAELEMINLHFSLLPRWRGAAPVERALLAGDTETGVCVMQLEEGLDTGGTYGCARVPIGPTTTADELRSELVAVGSRLLVDTLSRPLPTPVPQSGEATYASKLSPEDFRIDWNSSVEHIDRQVRVGGAFTTFRGERIKIHAAHIEAGALVPDIVQPAGRPAMAYDAWRNGAQPSEREWFE